MSESPFDLANFLADIAAMPVGSAIKDEPVEDDEVTIYAKAIANLDKQMELIGDALVEADEFKKESNAAIEEFLEAAKKLRNQITASEAEVFDQRRAIKRLEREKESQARLMQQAIHNKTLEEELAALQAQYDIITAGAPWREFAMDHQLSGARKIASSRRVILADKMGLGKTLTVIAACDMLQAKKIIAIVPNDVMRNFEREVERWAPHRTPIVLGGMNKISRRNYCRILAETDEFFILVNYEAWRKDQQFIDDLIALKADTLILDEAHNAKEMEKIAFRGVERLCFTENLIKSADERDYNVWFDLCSIKNVIPMTGTPILNRPQDLYSLLTLVSRETFGSGKDGLRRYLRDYCKQDPYTDKWKFAYGGLERLVRKLSAQYIMRDRKSAGIILPPQDIQYYNLKLTEDEYPNQYRVATQLSKYAAVVLDENRSANILYMIALITRKRQCMTWPAGIHFEDFAVDVHESIKIDRVIRQTPEEWDGLIPDFTNDGERDENGNWTGERVVVFSQFKEALKEIEARCRVAGIEVVRYDGDTPDSIADQVKLDFDRYELSQSGAKPKWQVCLANYRKGGVGLNFTDATQTIILDEEWNPGKRDQAYGRTQRIGQTKETTVHVLRVENSIESWMSDLIDSKQDMIDGFENNIDLMQALRDRLVNGEI